MLACVVRSFSQLVLGLPLSTAVHIKRDDARLPVYLPYNHLDISQRSSAHLVDGKVIYLVLSSPSCEIHDDSLWFVLCWKMVRPVTREGSEGSYEPLFLRIPLQKFEPPISPTACLRIPSVYISSVSTPIQHSGPTS